MASPSKTSLDALKASWASPNRQLAATLRKSLSPSPKTTALGSPARATSPQRNRRAHGAQAYQAEYLRNKSLQVTADAKDPVTRFDRGSVAQVDARVALAASSGLVWVGERDGGVAVLRGDGSVVHQIERRKGVYVWALLEVGLHVWLGCSDGQIRVVNSASYEVVHQIGHAGGGAGVHALVFHAPTNTVFSGSNDFGIVAWDASNYELQRQLTGHSGAVRALAVTDRLLFSGSDDSTIMAWEIASGTNIGRWSGHSKGVHALAVSSHGHVFSGGEDATIRIWTDGGECVGVADVRVGPVTALAVTGDKIWSAAGDTVSVWDSIHLKLLGSYVEHRGYVASIVPVERATRYQVWTFGSDAVAHQWSTESTAAEEYTVRQQAAKITELDHENGRLLSLLNERGREVVQLTSDLSNAAEEIESLSGVQRERDQLQEELAALRGQLQAAEARAAGLEGQLEALNLSHHELRGARDKLDETAHTTGFELQRLNTLLQEQHDQRVTTVQHLEHQIGDLRAKNADLQRSLAQQAEDHAAAKAEVIRQQGQLATMATKITDVEATLKSRLRLLTDVFGVFRKVEPVLRKAKSTAHPTGDATVKLEDVVDVWKAFKTVIGRHYSDDELAHLRSSRHFFPQDAEAKDKDKEKDGAKQ